MRLDDLVGAKRQEILSVAARHGAHNVRVCDTFLVTEAGPRNLYSTPLEYYVF